jgi:hypothetical protein
MGIMSYASGVRINLSPSPTPGGLKNPTKAVPPPD